MRALALFLVAACGSHSAAIDGSSGDDAAPGDDASIDVPFVKGTVHVTLANATAALCNLAELHVVFVDVDQTATDVVADADGKAQADVFPGASVTAICERTTGTTEIAVTVQDIEPGDDITLDGAYFLTGTRPADTTSAGTFEISFPAASGGGGYTVETPCGPVGTSQTNNVSLPMKAYCALSTMDLVVTTPTQWTEAANVSFTNNGSVTVTDTWHPMAAINASYTNAPAFCSDGQNVDYPCDVQLARYVPDHHGLSATAMTSLTSSGDVGVMSTTSSTATMQTRLEGAGGVRNQLFTDVVDGSETTYAIDLATRMLPWMCIGTAQCPMFSGADARLTIPVTGTATYDLFEADVQWARDQQIFIWRVFGPTAGDVAFPVLPASVATMNPQAADHQSATHARICESDALNGWRGARQNPFEALNMCVQSTNPAAPRYGGLHNRLSASQ